MKGWRENSNTALKVNFVFRKCCHLPFEQERSMENGSMAYAATYLYIYIIIPHTCKKCSESQQDEE